jgi:hypothetical protein
MNDVEAVRSVVLNRLSHSGTPTLTSSEVKMALGTVRRLQSHHLRSPIDLPHESISALWTPTGRPANSR